MYIESTIEHLRTQKEMENKNEFETKNFQIGIIIRNVPAESEESVSIELFDVIRAIQQLPYDFDVTFKRDGVWFK